MPTDWIVAAHLFATFAMTGIIWFVQVVHYPMLSHLPHENFGELEREHCDRTGFVVAPPMLLEAFTLGWLILEGFDSPFSSSLPRFWGSCGSRHSPCKSPRTAPFSKDGANLCTGDSF